MIRVLVVDDEILARVGIQSILENCGDIRVAGAFGLAGDALDFLKTNIVDIVITDIEMRRTGGAADGPAGGCPRQPGSAGGKSAVSDAPGRESDLAVSGSLLSHEKSGSAPEGRTADRGKGVLPPDSL